jgi:hypothetical protein
MSQFTQKPVKRVFEILRRAAANPKNFSAKPLAIAL